MHKNVDYFLWKLDALRLYMHFCVDHGTPLSDAGFDEFFHFYQRGYEGQQNSCI